MIELAFANQGDLSTYMQTKPPPPHEVRAKWIKLLVDTFSYVHARRIVVRDITLRNILVLDNSLKLSDFGETFLLSLETDMGRFCINGTTPKIEILHVGFILYSIIVWQELKYDYFYTERWPEAATDICRGGHMRPNRTVVSRLVGRRTATTQVTIGCESCTRRDQI
jgi:serine/threonine protein kinase